jgi:hypothetical protein
MPKHKETAKPAQEATLPQPPAELPEGLGDIVADISAQAPAIQQGVIDAYQADEKNAAPAAAPQPAVGVKKGRPLKPESELKQPRRVRVPKATETPQAIAQGNLVNQQTAVMFTELKEQLTIALIGDEWKLETAEKAAENTLLTLSLDKYAPAGMPVNPLVLYAAVSAGHAAKRFQQPKTQTWWAGAKLKLASWYLSLKQKKVSKNAPQPDSGPHNERQNNAGGAAGSAT